MGTMVPMQVTEGTVERAGLNILGLVTNLASQHLHTDLTSEVIAYMMMETMMRKMIIMTMMTRSDIQVVFFDVFGLFMLQYSSLTGVILNILSVTITLIISIVDIRISLRREKASCKDAVKILAIFFFGVFFIGSILALAFSVLVAYLLALVGRDMSWFASASSSPSSWSCFASSSPS